MASSLIYFFADLYPWWGLPLSFILFEVANYHRRHGAKGKMAVFAVLSLIFLTLAVIYIVFNGLENLRPSMQNLEKNYLKK